MIKARSLLAAATGEIEIHSILPRLLSPSTTAILGHVTSNNDKCQLSPPPVGTKKWLEHTQHVTHSQPVRAPSPNTGEAHSPKQLVLPCTWIAQLEHASPPPNPPHTSLITSLPSRHAPFSSPSLPARLASTDAAATAHTSTALSSGESPYITTETRSSESASPTVQALDSLFRSKAEPLGVGPNHSVVVSRKPGVSGMVLGFLGYYGKESQLIRGARALYSKCQKRADDEEFLAGFGLEKGFRASHALLVLHTWMVLVRLRAEATTEESRKDAAEVGQTVYDLFNHDCEKRVVAAGVTLLVSKWMKELEKNFYGACIAYDNALKPEAAKDALEAALWRNVIQDGEVFAKRSSSLSAAASRAMARYVRLQLASLSQTGSEAFMTGNISFTPLKGTD